MELSLGREPSLGHFRLGPFAWGETLAWVLSLGFAVELALGNGRAYACARNLGMGVLALEFSLGNFRSAASTFAWQLPLVNFRFGTFAQKSRA